MRAGGPMMYLTIASVISLNCSMMDALAGSFGSGIFKSILFATQTFSFESSKGADTDPDMKGLRLGRILLGKPYDRVRRGVGDRDTILGVDDDVEGRQQARRLYDLALFDLSAREIKQLIVRAIGNPNVAVRGDADAHQADRACPVLVSRGRDRPRPRPRTCRRRG